MQTKGTFESNSENIWGLDCKAEICVIFSSQIEFFFFFENARLEIQNCDCNIL